MLWLVLHLAIAQSNKPVETFETCWQLLDESYASFEEKGIDWNKAYTKYKPQVNESTTNEELFVVLTNMLKPLGDAHVNLVAHNIDTAFSADRYSRIEEMLAPLKGKKKPYVKAMTNQTLRKNGFGKILNLGPIFRNDTLFSYTRTRDVGYLRFFRSFSTYVNMVGPGLDNQMDQIFEYFDDVEAIIIDVRFNMGGDDKFSQKIAGRFVGERRVAFKKQTRRKKAFGELKEKYIKPESEKPFLKPVVLLTNDQTFSAADVLALIMGSLPNVTIIGEPSNGSYSDLYGKRLPNGWKITWSNQRYYSIDMKNYEGVGTPVDIEVKNTRVDIDLKNDSVLLEALKFLSDQTD